MANWWTRSYYSEKKLANARHKALIAGQQNSLLQEFIEHQKTSEQVRLGIWFPEKGEFQLSVEFNGEQSHQFLLEGDSAFEIQKNPALFIRFLYDRKESNRLNEKFCQLMESMQHMYQQKETILSKRSLYEKSCKKWGVQVSKSLLDGLIGFDVWEEEFKQLEKKKRHLLSDTPFIAERLEAVYQTFLAQRIVPMPSELVDPVERELASILDNEKLSDETKDKASTLLSAYREQKSEKEVEDIDTAEQEAQLILSTIEQHYMKGGSRKWYG